MEEDIQTVLLKWVVALRPELDMRRLSKSHKCPWQLQPQGSNAALPGFLLCQPGWLDRLEYCSLVGWFPDWLVSSGDQYSGHASLCLSRTGQRADQGC